jgi:hypothetical protein
MEKWKNKKVLCFSWTEYKGFYPVVTGIVIEETEEECLVKTGWIWKKWMFKHNAEKFNPATIKTGYCKLLL